MVRFRNSRLGFVYSESWAVRKHRVDICQWLASFFCQKYKYLRKLVKLGLKDRIQRQSRVSCVFLTQK